MGFNLGSIGSMIGGAIKQIAPAVLRAVAPAVSEGLKKITDGFVSGGANALKSMTAALPGPLGTLLNKGIDWGADKLKGLAGSAFDQLLQKLMGTPTQIPGAPAGTTGALPPMATPARAEITAAATAAANAGIAQAQASLPNGGVAAPSSGGTTADKAIAMLGTLTEPALPGKDATEQELAKFQRDLGKYNRLVELMSKVISSDNDVKKSVLQNIR